MGDNLKLVWAELGCFGDVRVLIYADARPRLQLKTQPRLSPVS